MIRHPPRSPLFPTPPLSRSVRRLSAAGWALGRAGARGGFTGQTENIGRLTPRQPSGKVFTESELKGITDLANRHNTWIVTDEIYEYITYDQPHISVGRFPEARDRTLTISGASKTYAVTGWRVGYAVGPAELIDRMAVVNDLLYICAPAPLQHGIVAGLACAAHARLVSVTEHSVVALGVRSARAWIA